MIEKFIGARERIQKLNAQIKDLQESRTATVEALQNECPHNIRLVEKNREWRTKVCAVCGKVDVGRYETRENEFPVENVFDFRAPHLAVLEDKLVPNPKKTL